MKKLLLSLLSMTVLYMGYGQNNFKATILDAETKEPLVAVHVLFEDIELGSITDFNGVVNIENLPNGTFEGKVLYVGYEEKTFNITFPQEYDLTIDLKSTSEELETITVTTTRSSRLIQDIPTRLEAITAEELGEKAFMNSTNISILLRESTGIQMQQTSANSANQSIRIQGLDGRYTQLLKDGFPIFGGFSSGLSIMQIPPLDLKQVDIIKGSASTLYGGGAIAGLINLVTKRPDEEPQLELMLTQTQASGTTLNNFYAQQFGKVGVSLYTSGHLQNAYDVNEDDFSDIPQVRSLSINPAFYYDFDGLATQISYQKQFSENAELTIKNSINFFDRSIVLPDFNFDGQQTASFSEISYHTKKNDIDILVGANLWTDNFTEEPTTQTLLRDYTNNTVGVFAQSTLPLSEKIAVE